MMCRPSRWWLGLAPLAALFLVALFVKGPQVEADVAAHARAALEGQGVIDPAVAAEGRDVRIAGLATGEPAKIREAVLAASGVRKVTDELKSPPLAKPYAVSAVRGPDGVRLSGAVPNPAARAALAQAAASLGKVKDETTYASGAPQGYAAMTGAALSALAPLSTGSVSLSDGALSVIGEAPSSAALETAQSAVKALPSGMTLAKFDVKPPTISPYSFTARRDGPRLNLSGYAPDAVIKGRLLDAARQMSPQVEDGLRLAGGAPLGFEAMARAALSALAPLPKGEAVLTGPNLSLTGEAGDRAGYDAARAILAALPSGMKLDKAEIAAPAQTSFAIPPAPVAPTPTMPSPQAPAKAADPVATACHGRILERLADETIEFATGSARIAPKSGKLIDRLAEVIKSCPDADLEVAGHTDNVGDPASNLALSRERAAAVVKALIEAGAPAPRLSSAGYGDAKPIAANDTAEGRARNRRIEFVLK